MTDLLQRLQRAIPLAEDWIEELHAQHRSHSTPTCEAGVARLAEYFPADLLASTRYAIVPRVPYPPAADYGVPELAFLGHLGLTGITFDDMYFVQPGHLSAKMHFHELVHVLQWQTLGVRDFLLTYTLGVAQHGYRDSPLEVMAYDLEDRFEQNLRLTRIPDVIAAHALEARAQAAAVFARHGLSLDA